MKTWEFILLMYVIMFCIAGVAAKCKLKKMEKHDKEKNENEE